MPLLRFILPIGALFLGAVAVFMGAVVLLSSLRAGQISTSWQSAEGLVMLTRSRASEPEEFWKLVGLFGALPLAFGGAAIWWGRRTMRRQPPA